MEIVMKLRRYKKELFVYSILFCMLAIPYFACTPADNTISSANAVTDNKSATKSAEPLKENALAGQPVSTSHELRR